MKTKNRYKLLFILLIVVVSLVRLLSKNDIVSACSGFVILYSIILGYSSYFSTKFNKSFYESIPLTFILIILLLTIFGLINLLLFGVILITLFGLTLLIFQVYKGEFYLSLILKKELCFFTIIFLILFVANYFVAFNVWDEYTYWSIASKNFYYSNTINFSTFNTMPNHVVTWYPPNPTIFQYYFMKIFGSYRQGFELLASQMLGFSLLLPLFKFSKNKIQTILISIICLCIPAIFCESLFYNTIYVDTLLGLITGYGLINIINKEHTSFSNLLIGLSITLACITKASGFMFSFIILLFYVVYNFLEKHRNNNSLKETIICCLKDKYVYIFTLLVLIPLVLWRFYCYSNEPINNYVLLKGVETGTTVSSVGEFFQSVIGAVTGYNYNQFSQSIENSTEHLLTKKYYSTEPFNLSSYNWIIIILSFLLIVYFIKKDKDDIKSISMAIILTFMSYLILLQLSYLFMFDIKEAIAHNSAQRYIGSLLLGLLILCIYYILNSLKDNTYFDKIIVCVTLIIMFFTPINVVINSTVLSGSRNRTSMGYLVQEKELSEKILKHVEKEQELLTINQGINNSLLKVIHFATPFRVYNMPKLDENLYLNNDIETKIKESKYLLIIESDDFIQKKLNDIFKYSEVENMTLYKNNDGILEKIKE